MPEIAAQRSEVYAALGNVHHVLEGTNVPIPDAVSVSR